jgi:hypothetical protein
MYLAAVENAVATPGRWIEIPRGFDTEFNASITVTCLEGGYLRVQPRAGDEELVVRGKRYIKTAALVDSRTHRIGDEWRVSIRFAGVPK